MKVYYIHNQIMYITYLSQNIIMPKDFSVRVPPWESVHFPPQLNPRQTERTMIRINAIKIPKTINLIFMFCSHIFLRIFVPLVLKSCACTANQIKHRNWEYKECIDCPLFFVFIRGCKEGTSRTFNGGLVYEGNSGKHSLLEPYFQLIYMLT